MEGQAYNLISFFKDDVTVEVPFFQRPYVWNEKNWSDLYQSINEENQQRMPFIGSFIFQRTNDERKFLVIDGQQRITTLSIFVKALLDVVGELNPDPKTRMLSIIYKTEYGVDMMTPVYSPRLTPSTYDKPDYDFVMSENIDDAQLANQTGSIVEAYKFFRREFNKLNKAELYKIGGKILTNKNFFLIILLGIEDDEQKIFDSVNNFGQRLTFADSIKNFLFQQLRSYDFDNLRQKEVMKIYAQNWDEPFYKNEKKKFWYEEKNLGKQSSTNLEEFLKDFATIKGFYRTSLKINLSEAYKTYIRKLDYDELKSLTSEMKDYANAYFEMMDNFKLNGAFKISDVLNTTLLILNELDSTTFIPVVLKLYKNQLQDSEKMLFALQKFILMRLIYDESNKNYNKVAESLLDKDNSDEAINYLNNYSMDKADLTAYPSGLEYIPSRNNNRATILLFLVELIRRYKRGEEKYSDALQYNKTLEHIIPQKWRKWSNVDCYDFNAEGNYVLVNDKGNIEEVRNKKIYSIGNMTLLNGPLNTSIGNDVFEIKIQGKTTKRRQKEGIRNFVGSLSIAKEIVDKYDEKKTWDERDINERAEELFKELNEYYNFTNSYIKQNKSILYKNIIADTIDCNDVKDNISDDFLANSSIGIVMKETMKYLIKNEKLTEDDLRDLQDKEFSSQKLGCWLPVLAKENLTDRKDRYYKDTLEYKGTKYLLCREFFDRYRDKIILWIKSKI